MPTDDVTLHEAHVALLRSAMELVQQHQLPDSGTASDSDDYMHDTPSKSSTISTMSDANHGLINFKEALKHVSLELRDLKVP
jgi:hypothetical protein